MTDPISSKTDSIGTSGNEIHTAGKAKKLGRNTSLRRYLLAGWAALCLLMVSAPLNNQDTFVSSSPDLAAFPPEYPDSGDHSEPVHSQNARAESVHELRRPVFWDGNGYENHEPEHEPDSLDQDAVFPPFREMDLISDEMNKEAQDQYLRDAEKQSDMAALPSSAVSNATNGAFFSEFETSTIPALLGSITVGPADTVSDMIYQIYGTVNNILLDLVAKANPQIQDLNNVPVGSTIHFPALTPRRFSTPFQEFWLSAGRFDSLEQAAWTLVDLRKHHESLVLLSGYTATSGLSFEIMDLTTFSDPVAARQAAEELHQKLDVPVDVSGNWWEKALFLTDLPASKSPFFQETYNDESDSAADQKAIMSEKIASVESVKIPIPPKRADGIPRPQTFQQGGHIHTYTLLADGFQRVYRLREAGRSEQDAGFIQVVAHAHRDLADKEVDVFLGQGWPAAVFAVEVDGRIYHRVLIGPFASPDQAQKIQQHARDCVQGLTFIKQAMKDAQIAPLGDSDEAHVILLKTANPQQAAELLEDFGWPVFRISGNTLSIGPLRDEISARAYQKKALEGNGWGPLHPSSSN
ncbi:MAG TPA: SPOR domain-containing protein [Desulfonatronum sp.]|nr:SPOR domain-containing protein [Desulfonatronum sp.]